MYVHAPYKKQWLLPCPPHSHPNDLDIEHLITALYSHESLHPVPHLPPVAGVVEPVRGGGVGRPPDLPQQWEARQMPLRHSGWPQMS